MMQLKAFLATVLICLHCNLAFAETALNPKVEEDKQIEKALTQTKYDQCIDILKSQVDRYQRDINQINSPFPFRSIGLKLQGLIIDPLLGDPLMSALSSQSDTLDYLGAVYILKGDSKQAESIYFRSIAAQEAVCRIVYKRDYQPKIREVHSVVDCLDCFKLMKSLTVCVSGIKSVYTFISEAGETLLALSIAEELDNNFDAGEALYRASMPYLALGCGGEGLIFKQERTKEILNGLLQNTIKRFGSQNKHVATVYEMLAICYSQTNFKEWKDQKIAMSIRTPFYSKAVAIREQSNDIEDVPFLIEDLLYLKNCADWENNIQLRNNAEPNGKICVLNGQSFFLRKVK